MRRLTEDSFSTRIHDDQEIPVLELDNGWIVSYGHIEFEEFVGWVASYYREALEDVPEVEHEEVQWVWARAKTSRYDDEWSVTWSGVTADDEDAFPLTVLAVW